MTSLDPSHFPSISLGDPTGGKAIYRPSSPGAQSFSSLDSHESLPSPRIFPAIAVPDLRFEQGYLMSIRPFFYLQPETTPINPERTNRTDNVDDLYYLGRNFRVKWALVMWVTLRDQMFYPMMQGALWGTMSLFITQVWRVRTSTRSPSSSANKRSGSWSKKLSNLIGGAKSNVV
eukprot:GHVU01014604.1.p1 GENE.GHVU01014604.1~~GHVU01014604.1.p1  ORF type:complete len:199 (+),score=5.58 GHVU01014604.1:74-598(+)